MANLAVQVKSEIADLVDRLRMQFPGVPVSSEEFDSGTVSVYFDLSDGSFIELEYSSRTDSFGISRIAGSDRMFTLHDEVMQNLAEAEARLCELLAEAAS